MISIRPATTIAVEPNRSTIQTVPATPRAPAAFTLVELLVVVSIISVLVAMLIPSMEAAVKEAKISVCASNLHSVGVALAQYTLDHNQKLPWVGAYYNTAQMMYTTYQPTGPKLDPRGFQNLGLLIKPEASYVPLRSKLWFCPLQTSDNHTDSEGNPTHKNAVPRAGRGLAPGDEALGWINERAGYLRRKFEGDTAVSDPLESISTMEVGARAFVADVFSSPTRIEPSHIDSINFLYGDGHVTKHWVNPRIAPYWTLRGQFGPGKNGNVEQVWSKFDGG